ncbi:hypothetical protein [Pseudomonas mandelii]|uniref:hypothetical protein n=1 Tax=Pseudomonas mandelii TaxID=75612 RepID=UPI00224A7382|nr:hypothetical protein [Pseudomonas mandelii]MCX2896392.1 hypothetical protein [Pseudomonas mandelii]
MPSPNLAFPFDTAQEVERLRNAYRVSGQAQEVSFRELVPWMKVGERATHYLHSYPAKLLPHIAHFFLAASNVSKKDDIVLDPFGGTGTVVLEAALAGHTAVYSDSNPLARLISSVKTKSLNSETLMLAYDRVMARFKLSRSKTAPDVVNIDHWFEPRTIRDLCRLKSAVEAEEELCVRNFCLATFSAIIRKVSLADPRLSVPVKLKPYDGARVVKKISVLDAFVDQFYSNVKRMSKMQELNNNLPPVTCIGTDARNLKCSGNEVLPSESIGLIITSPPYAGAQKYIRASSLNLGWLGLIESTQLRALEDLNIGREHLPKSQYTNIISTGIPDADSVLSDIYVINPLRSAIAALYLLEMRQALTEAVRVLRKGGRLILVIGNNEVCGKEFKSSEYLQEICVAQGLEVELKLIDSIKSRGLMTKRNRSASLITREWVLVFRKPS